VLQSADLQISLGKKKERKKGGKRGRREEAKQTCHSDASTQSRPSCAKGKEKGKKGGRARKGRVNPMWRSFLCTSAFVPREKKKEGKEGGRKEVVRPAMGLDHCSSRANFSYLLIQGKKEKKKKGGEKEERLTAGTDRTWAVSAAS